MYTLSMLFIFPKPQTVGDRLMLAIAWFICTPIALILLGVSVTFLMDYLSRRCRICSLKSEISSMGEAELITGTVKELRQSDAGQLLALVEIPPHPVLPREMLLTVVHECPAPGEPFKLLVFPHWGKLTVMTEQDYTALCLNIDMDADAVQRKAKRSRTVCILFAAFALPLLIFSLGYFFSILW